MASGTVVSLNVGLDVGTASTKVVVQDIVERRRPPLALRIGPSVPGYPLVGTPSALAIDDGRVYFGAEALKRAAPAVIIRSFKMCVACKYQVLDCRECVGRATNEKGAICGTFLLSKQAKSMIDAEYVAVLFVAWIRGEIERAVQSHFGKGATVALWNMSVPLVQVDHDPLGNVFQRILLAAGELQSDMRQGVDAATAFRLAQEAWKKVEPLVGKDNAGAFVVPETVSALLGLVKLKGTKEGLYGLVDVGAGTTDVSIFRYWDPGIQKLIFYAANAEAVGGDLFDVAAAEVLSKLVPGKTLAELALAAQHGRVESGGRFDVAGVACDLSSPEVEGAEGKVAARVWRTTQAVFGKAYEKEKLTSRWKDLPLLLAGGGGRLSSVGPALQRKLSPYITEQPIRRLEVDTTVEPGPGLTNADLQASRDFLLVAHGLSYPLAEYPDTIWPSAVKPKPKPTELPRFHSDDLYGR